MEFKSEALVLREIQIARYLLRDLSLRQIAGETGLSKKHLVAHVKNMMEKLGAENFTSLKKMLAAIIPEQS